MEPSPYPRGWLPSHHNNTLRGHRDRYDQGVGECDPRLATSCLEPIAELSEAHPSLGHAVGGSQTENRQANQVLDTRGTVGLEHQKRSGFYDVIRCRFEHLSNENSQHAWTPKATAPDPNVDEREAHGSLDTSLG